MRFQNTMNFLQAACFYDAEKTVYWLKDRFEKDSESLEELINYKEPQGGNMAIHFAVINGNKKVIDCLLNDFNADPMVQTNKGLSVIHCAAQYDRGVLSIVYFRKRYNLNVDLVDGFKCTPLHFAVLNK